ncbi:MAG: SPOR domain-containing protein [Bacteroidaceae bacterium]|nr:SPOR domain-containing protein [Bacteroidaceae bacterium]
MIELSTHIEYLLLHRDEVSVPGLGTFTVREMSSKRVDEECIFLPPYRTVSFKWNELETGEDFILSFSKLHNLSRNDSRMMCVEYVDELLQTLEEDGTVSFGSMGYMTRNAETGQVNFIPQQSGIASPSYYGLDAVPFAKLSHEVRQQRAKKQAANKVRLTSIQADQDTITIRINRRAFNYASAVAASVLLFFAITSPFGKSITSGVSQQAEMFFATKFLPSVKPEPKAVEAQPVAKEEPQAAPVQAAPKDYAIVLASAISPKRALNYAAQLQEKGYNAQACTVGKMVRVIVPGFASEDEAAEKIRQYKAECSDFAQAWPLKLKGEVNTLE